MIIEHREINDPVDILGYDPTAGNGRLRVRCDICGELAICPGRVSMKTWQRQTGWIYRHNGPGWICPSCNKNIGETTNEK